MESFKSQLDKFEHFDLIIDFLKIQIGKSIDYLQILNMITDQDLLVCMYVLSFLLIGIKNKIQF